MDSVNKKMKKFNLRGVLDGLRSSVSAPQKPELEIEETLRSEHFQVAKTVRHGFPYQPTAMAYDPVQNLLAIGTKSGSLRIFGRPGVDCHVKHDSEYAVMQVQFLVNEGALVTVTADDQLHLWTLRQKRPEIVHSLKFQRERITYFHLPFQSKWLYIGTERGNVHIVNIESFVLSGYIINWNKAIELTRKTHPGPVVHLSGNPMDSNKIPSVHMERVIQARSEAHTGRDNNVWLLIGFETGAIVLWDLKSKSAEARFNYSESLKSVSWHHEGKQFMCSHGDGSLTVWNYRMPQKPQSIMMPHACIRANEAEKGKEKKKEEKETSDLDQLKDLFTFPFLEAKIGKDGKPEPCRPVNKVEWTSVRNGEPYVIFSGGMPFDKATRTPSLTVMHAKNTTVLEMEHNVIDFLTLCATPWNNDFQDPYGIVVLLQNDLVVVDLTSPGYPCFENPYPMDIHESPVTACLYLADCPPDLIPAFYSCGSKQKKTGFSENDWPVKGGEWGTTTCSYPEILITGHADGSLKFWDASAVTLQVLYKLKTAKVFDRSKCKNPDPDDDPFAIQHLYLCPDSRLLCVAGLGHVILFKFSKTEGNIDCLALEISIVYEIYDDLDSPELEYPPVPPKPSIGNVSQQSGSVGSYSSTASDGKPERESSVKVKSGPRKWSSGYQPDLTCVLMWIDGEPPPPITSLSVNSKYGLLAFGNDCGIAVVDFVQKSCLLNMGTPDLYGSMDPYSRAPRSPKSKSQLQAIDLSQPYTSEECKSPTTDQCDSTILHTVAHNQEPGEKKNGPIQSTPSLASIKETPQFTISVVEQGHKDDKSDGESQTNYSRENLQSTHKQVLCSSKTIDEAFAALEYLESTKDESSVFCESDEEKRLYLTSISGKDHKNAGGDVPVKPPRSKKLASKNCSNSSESSLQSISPQRSFSSPVDERQPPEKRTVSRVASDGPQYVSGHEGEEQADNQHKPRRRSSIFTYFTKRKEEKIDSDLTDGSSGVGTRQFRSENDLKTYAHSTSNHSLASSTLSSSGTSQEALDEIDSSSQKNDNSSRKEGFARRMSRKMRHAVVGKKWEETVEECIISSNKKRGHQFQLMDLSMEDVPENPPVKKIFYAIYCQMDKTDGSFSRSRSSSMSSLENVNKEAIQCLAFADAYTRKSESLTSPCLWVGTSLGSVLVISMNLPEGEARKTQPVIVSPSGTIFRLKGAIMCMSFLDCNGILIPQIAEAWKEQPETPTGSSRKQYNRQQSTTNMRPKMSPTSSQELQSDRQFAIICSEKQARVMTLPSQSCAYKVKITETSIVTKAEVISLKESVCLACYVANGHVMTFSLPSLKPLLDVNHCPLTDIRIAKTFCFGNNGHALYFISPTEVQKITLSAEVCDNLNEMLGELFLPTEAPDAPKQSFFKNLFGGGTAILDREELFGEGSGKASKGVAKYSGGTAGMAMAQDRAGAATSEIGRAKMAAIERGERLGQLDDTTEKMRMEAEAYAQNTHLLMQKYRDKKWYQF